MMDSLEDDNTANGSTSLILNKLYIKSAQAAIPVCVELGDNHPRLTLKPQASPDNSPSFADVLALCIQSNAKPDKTPT